MATFNPYAAALPVALAGFKIGEGISQGKKGRKLLGKTRPEYKTPKEQEDAYRLARFNYGTASSNIQEAGKNELDDTFSQTVGAATQAATDSSGLLAALTAAQGAKNRANIQLNNNAIGQKQNDLNALLTASNTYSQYKDKEWDWNKKQPYQDAMLAASSLIKAGKENIYGGLNDIANVGISSLGNINTGEPTQPIAAGAPDPNLIPSNNPTAIAAMSYKPVVPATVASNSFNSVAPNKEQFIADYANKGISTSGSYFDPNLLKKRNPFTPYIDGR